MTQTDQGTGSRAISTLPSKSGLNQFASAPKSKQAQNSVVTSAPPSRQKSSQAATVMDTPTTMDVETESNGIEVWSETEDPTVEFEDRLPEPPPDIPQLDHSNAHANALVQWLVYFLLLLQARYHLADNVLQFLFRFLKAFFDVLGRVSSACSHIAKVFPRSLYQAQKSTGTDTKSSNNLQSVEYVIASILFHNVLRVMESSKETSIVLIGHLKTLDIHVVLSVELSY